MTILEQTQAALAPLFPAQEEPPAAAEPEGEEPVEAATSPAERRPGVATTEYSRQGYHLEVLCEPGQLVAVAEILDRQRFFIESIAGVDWPKQEQLEVVYDFTTYEAEPCRVAVRTVVPRTAPLVPTISGVFSGADWHERETFDFYGIIFDGHPDLSRILLPEDADFHPLLKDYMP